MFADAGENLDEAVTFIKRALEIDPNNGAYIDSLGWAYFKKGMHKEALVELEKAIKFEPNDPDIKEHLKTIKEKLKR
jgi:Flp pilus assembly protein TadD